MNREILFKGKTIKGGKWIEGSLIIDTRGNYYIGEYIPLNKDINIVSGRTQGKTLNQFAGIGFAMVDPTTVCQFTGLTDKNGNKVFEGDVVKTKYGRVCRVTSICCEGYVGFDLDALETEHKMPTEYDLFASRNIEVIGNIFDNKELLDKPTDDKV